MSESAFKYVATTANFATTVVEASRDRPVLVDFWAPWCGPCRTLMPMLDRIADDYGGRFALAKVNTDEEQQVAAHFQIRSIPTVMLFHQGQVVEQFVGVQPEQAIRTLIDRHLGSATGADPESPAGLAAQAEAEITARDAAAAGATLERLAARDPEHRALGSLRARLAFVEAATARPDVASLRAALERDPADSAARHALAAHHALAGDYATALSEWLELMRRDRKFEDDLARRSLLSAFDVLGEDHEFTKSYRRRMASLLH
ncbi:MAG: thioredoxin [Gammaproteobacteria bacterium]|nr:thioredoxin [Gammaproteobacteria bacterium]